MASSTYTKPDETIGYAWEYCRCCGGPVRVFDGHPIHTRCIPKHWTKHAHHINASRCREFSKR